MLDSRYPFLMRIEDSEIPESMRKYYRRVADEVSSRTGLSYCYRKPSGELYFYLGDPSRGVYGEPIRFKDTSEPWRKIRVDSLVKLLVQWKASPSVKRGWVAEQERLDAERREKEQERFFDSRRKDSKDHFKKLRTNRKSFLKTGRLGEKAVS